MICSFRVFLCSLAAAQGLLGGRETIFSPLSPLSSSSSVGSGGICLNGGTSVPSLTSGRHMFCLCADGFEGTRCDTAISKECYEGVGLYYRGSASTSASGLTCETWDEDTRSKYLLSDQESGRHNHCRNLQYRMRPWCYVRRNLQVEWEYCDVPRCGTQSFPGSADPGPAETPASSDAVPALQWTCGQRRRPKLMKIVGGSVSTVEAQPWVSAIFYRRRSKGKVFLCGGSLIHSCWVLTAAHCFPNGIQKKPQLFSVSLGRNALNQSDATVEQNFRVEEIIVHEGFDHSEGTFNHDIALLRLRAKRGTGRRTGRGTGRGNGRGQCAVESRWVKTVCLPPPFQKLLPGTTCEVAGYGKEKHGLWYQSQYLREAQVDLIPDSVCQRDDYYGNALSANMFCAGSADWSRDACEGDSGGPLVCAVADRFFLFGVVSWGEGCAQRFKPGVYTTVTNYNHWVEEKTGVTTIATGAMFPQK